MTYQEGAKIGVMKSKQLCPKALSFVVFCCVNFSDVLSIVGSHVK